MRQQPNPHLRRDEIGRTEFDIVQRDVLKPDATVVIH